MILAGERPSQCQFFHHNPPMDGLGENPCLQNDWRSNNHLRHGTADNVLTSLNYCPSFKEAKWIIKHITAYNVCYFMNG
jgi:hypothetical protein